MSSGAASLVVSVVDQNGNALKGYQVNLYSGTGTSTLIATGYSPVTFSGLAAGTYTVDMLNTNNQGGSCTFSSWVSYGTDPIITGTLSGSGSVPLVANYSCPTTSTSSSSSSTTSKSTTTSTTTATGAPSVTIQSVNQNGQSITGYWTALRSSTGKSLATGYTTKTFTSITVGTNYEIELDSYGSCTFSHWQDSGSSVDPRTFTATAGPETFIGVFTCT